MFDNAMPATDLQLLTTPPVSASPVERFVDVIASPADVFAEVAASGPTPINWRLPALLVCLTNLAIIIALPLDNQGAALVESAGKSAPNLDSVSANFRLISMLTICGAAAGGTFWSAFVLWVIGKVFLKARFSYGKALEVAGLASVILALGAIFTAILTSVVSDGSARPALSLLLSKSEATGRLHNALDVFNVFHLWSTTLMAIGLSKLTATSFKECAFWVFGYWVALRFLLALLS